MNLYGLVYVLGFIVYFILIKSYLKSKNKDPDFAITATILSIIGTLLGARLVYVFYYYPEYFLKNPFEIFYLWKGGLSFHGGLIGIVTVNYFFWKKKKINTLEIGDLLAAPSMLFLSLGRIINFFNKELYGTITTVPWCVYLNKIGCAHPVQIYESISDLLVFFILLIIKNKNRKTGVIFFSALFFYSLFRFFVDFFRVYEKYFFGLGSGQYLSLITLIISGYFLIRIKYHTYN